jgi:signal transduction histidine kinase/ActR/RegA family two-component response regulator
MIGEASHAGAHRLDLEQSSEELKRLLEQERLARLELAAEAALQRRVVEALEQLSVALRGSDDDQRLQRLLQVFADSVGADAAAIWLKDEAMLKFSALLGAEQPPEAAAPLALATVFGGAQALEAVAVGLVKRADSELLARSFGDDSGLVSGIQVALADGAEPVAVLCLGLRRADELGENERRVLQALGGQATIVLVQQLTSLTLRQAVRSRDDILGIVAHDLRNPLNVISAAANSLHHRLPDTLARRPLERIIRAAQRAEHLIRDLLDISAIEGGHFAIDKHNVDTTQTILAAIESQQGLAASASVILASDLSPELPWVEADEERILEVLENLVGNAVKFTMAGGTVTIGASYRDQELLVWVKDNGPGIGAEALPHLFDRFWQASKRDRRGTGLGLTICRAIVEAHGGRIWAESQTGVGTTVYFTIPGGARLKRAQDNSVANILLVDDRPENLLSLKAILERPDYRLVTASSGEEALSLALRQPFAVALIDVAMPGMDGLEVAVHMKELERSRDIPIIFITAFGDDPQEIHRAYSAGGADYLVKPLDTEIVRKKVAVFVDLSRRRHESERLSLLKGEE